MKSSSLIPLLLLLAACTSATDKLTLAPARFDALPGWEQDDHREALATFLKSCESILKKGDDATQGKDMLAAPANLWKPACNRAEGAAGTGAGDVARAFFEREFVPFTAA